MIEEKQSYYGHCPKCGVLLGFGHEPKECTGASLTSATEGERDATWEEFCRTYPKGVLVTKSSTKKLCIEFAAFVSERAKAGVGAESHDVEEISAKVHEQWMESKRAKGVTSRKSESGEELMVPYEQLSESAKDLDRGSVKAVLNAMKAWADMDNNPRCPKCKSPWKEQRNHVSWGIGDLCQDAWHTTAQPEER